ncbi:MAG: hypothetical protein R3272_03245 [Candidatus Promineifilaceae bacterium]|nr:hypothetical protein [Candidatus Promineifilaceae bacterium]
MKKIVSFLFLSLCILGAQQVADPVQAAQQAPTATATTPTPETTPTAVPTATATATPPPPPVGTICVNAFADPDGDGLHDAGEGAMAGVTFTVVSEDGEVWQGISSGPEPVCFLNLLTGSYQVAQAVPATLESTTGTNIEVELDEDETVMIEFGSRLRPEPQDITVDDTVSSETVSVDVEEVVDTAGVAAVEEAEGFSLLAVSGLAAIFLALILLGVLFFLWRRRSA